MFQGGFVLICFLAVLILIVFAAFLYVKKNRIHSDSGAGSYTKRSFTKEDRRAALLIKELGDIIDTVEKKLQ